jgi:hypothetical protein
LAATTGEEVWSGFVNLNLADTTHHRHLNVNAFISQLPPVFYGWVLGAGRQTIFGLFKATYLLSEASSNSICMKTSSVLPNFGQNLALYSVQEVYYWTFFLCKGLIGK